MQQEIMSLIDTHIKAISFPPSSDGGDSQITLPFVFE